MFAQEILEWPFMGFMGPTIWATESWHDGAPTRAQMLSEKERPMILLIDSLKTDCIYQGFGRASNILMCAALPAAPFGSLKPSPNYLLR